MGINHISIYWFEVNTLGPHVFALLGCVVLPDGGSIGHIASGCNSVEGTGHHPGQFTSVSQGQRQSCTLTPRVNSESPINLIYMLKGVLTRRQKDKKKQQQTMQR